MSNDYGFLFKGVRKVEGVLRNKAIDLTRKRRSSILLSILQEAWYNRVKKI